MEVVSARAFDPRLCLAGGCKSCWDARRFLQSDVQGAIKGPLFGMTERVAQRHRIDMGKALLYD